jgi:hypothetical protein
MAKFRTNSPSPPRAREGFPRAASRAFSPRRLARSPPHVLGRSAAVSVARRGRACRLQARLSPCPAPGSQYGARPASPNRQRAATEERAPPPQAAQGNWRSTREASGRWTERCRLGRAKFHCSPPYPGRTSPAGRSGPGAPRSRSAAARLHPALAACSRGVYERNAWSVLAERGRPNNPSAVSQTFRTPVHVHAAHPFRDRVDRSASDDSAHAGQPSVVTAGRARSSMTCAATMPHGLFAVVCSPESQYGARPGSIK